MGAAASRAVAGVATVGAAVLLGALVVSVHGPATASLDTVVVSSSPGSSIDGGPAVPGAVVPRGAVVRTPGGALLRTGTRTVALAAHSALTVLDGARERLDEGSALVDAAQGRGVAVDAGAAVVAVPGGATVRLDRAAVLRVVSYRGAVAARPAGRGLATEVPQLHQVQVPYGALPGRATPLALTPGDEWERQVLPALVATDQDLDGVAAGLAASPLARTLVAALPAAVQEVPGVQRSAAEAALAYALGRSAPGPAAAQLAAFRAVRDGRQLGGSWGVVATLVSADVLHAEAFLVGAEPTPPGLAGGSAAAQPGALLDLALGLPAAAGPAAAVPVAPDPGGAAPPVARRPGRGASPAPVGIPGPGPLPGPVPGPVSGPVRDLVGAVVGLLPAPLSALPLSALPLVGTPAPVPTRGAGAPVGPPSLPVVPPPVPPPVAPPRPGVPAPLVSAAASLVAVPAPSSRMPAVGGVAAPTTAAAVPVAPLPLLPMPGRLPVIAPLRGALP